jgi:mRNA interferase MazF
MPPPPVDRGEVWLTDLGMTAKVRPCLVLSVRPGPADRVLFALVPHTTSLHGTAYEVTVPAPFLKPGAFDAQGLVTVPRPRLIRRLGVLSPVELAPVEAAVRAWLGL